MKTIIITEPAKPMVLRKSNAMRNKAGLLPI